MMGRAAALLGSVLALAGCGPSQPVASALAAAGARPAAAAKPQAILPEVRAQAPDAAFHGAAGEPVTLQQFAGRVVVLNLWATWCAPCVREMPSLDALARRAPDTAVVAVSMDVQGPEVASGFLSRRGLDRLDVFHDPDGRLMRELGVYGLPVSLVIDREGRVAATIKGAVDWDGAEMRELLTKV